MFGNGVWNNTIIGITDWDFSDRQIKIREQKGETEADVLAVINQQLRQTYNVPFDLPGVFIDAFYESDDGYQHFKFLNETQKLWDFANSHEGFPFETIDDIQNGITKMKGRLSKRKDVRKKVKKGGQPLH